MFYSIVKVIFQFLFKILFRVEVRGAENVPAEGSIIMAANHMSNFDPPLVGSFFPRPVAYMAKEELFHPKLAGLIIKNLYAFPVKRGTGDKGAIMTAIGILRNKHCLGVFPEGTRSKTGEIGKPESGVAALAALGKALVVPTAIIGTDKFSKGKLFPKLAIIIGEPMECKAKTKDKEGLQNFAQEIMDKIKEMKDSYEAEKNQV